MAALASALVAGVSTVAVASPAVPARPLTARGTGVRSGHHRKWLPQYATTRHLHVAARPLSVIARGAMTGGGEGGQDGATPPIGRGSGGGGYSGRSLPALCNALDAAFFELCVDNCGRPAARALQDFVEAAVEAHLCGFSLTRVTLQLSLAADAKVEGNPALSPLALDGDSDNTGKRTTTTTTTSSSINSSSSSSISEFRLSAAGYRLTLAEERYRSQWLQIIFLTLQRLRSLRVVKGLGGSGSGSSLLVSTGEQVEGGDVEDVDPWLVSIVDRVLEGQVTGDEQSAVQFDRALATGGASGGVAAERVAIAPQWVPASQLVLLTVKVLKEVQRGRL